MSTNLNAKVYELRNGISRQSTIREVIALGSGWSYEKLKATDTWPQLLAKYEAEISDPLATLKENVRVAFKTMVKAKWWLEEGVARNYMDPTGEHTDDARSDYDHANSALQEAFRQRSAFDRWREVTPWCCMHLDVQMTSAGYGSIPLYPWVSGEKTITTLFKKTAHKSEEVVAYPEDTILRFFYTTSPNFDQHEIKAIVAGGYCTQVLPTMASYVTVKEWVETFPSSTQAYFTVTLSSA